MIDSSLERLHTQLQPEKVADLTQLEDLLARFTAFVVSQSCMEPVSLRAQDSAGVPQIVGWVCYPAQLSALLTLAAAVPLKGIELEVHVLPAMEFRPPEPHSTLEHPPLEHSPKIGDFRLSGQPGLFSSCRKAATGHAQADENSKVVHVWSVWEAIRPLYRDNGWTLCQTSNGYLGWVDNKELSLEENAPAPHSFMPSQSLKMLTETALEYLGEPYLWGGTGSGGIDCSGFTAAVHERRGLVLPRDAHEQMLGGRIVATHDDRLPLRTGDLLFFTHEDGRIGHVGLSLGEGKVIHAGQPRVSIISMNPGDPDFDAYRSRHFVLAKRYLL